MKKLLLLFVFATVTFPLFAQKFEVGVNGGINAYTSKDREFYLNEAIGNANIYATGNISGAYKYKQWNAGIAADFYQMGIYSPAFHEWDPIGGLRFFIPTRVFVNRTFLKGNFKPYAGVSVGTILNPLKQTYVLYPHQTERHGNLTTGFCSGVQLGYTHFFSKHFGINQELSVSYFNISSMYPKFRPSVELYAYALTLGLRYRI